MQTAIRKVYLSILTSIMVLITVVATTYAWVGIFTYSSLEGFNINLKVDDANKSYYLKISTDGINFKESVDLIDIQKQIMDNMGIEYESFIDSSDADAVDRYFNKTTELVPVTTTMNYQTNELDKFFSMENIKGNKIFEESNKYFKFDLYLMVEPREGVSSTTNLNANIFLSDIGNSLKGTKSSGTLTNGNPFSSLPSSEEFMYPLLKEIPRDFSIDSSYATRFALSIYNPILIDDTYTAQTPNKTIIYQGGTSVPSKNGDIYSLGGILPEEYNMALKEFNKLQNLNLDITNVDPNRLNDLELVGGNDMLWVRPDVVDDVNYNYFGVSNGKLTKIKITVYFWFEGWDADCLNFINKKNVTLNLKFSTDLN